MHLEGGFPPLWVSGELSNLARPASGHLYFTLKDERAQIRCALFRGQASHLGFQPENGQQVLVRGRLGLYEPRGDYQLIAEGMLEAGAGALAQAFEALKKKLSAEGLFDEARKQPLPAWPERISVVTSPSGAALRDILRTLAQRWPSARVRIYPSQVQGETAPAELIRALKAADRHGFGQVILLARGGGSIEDLWAFNDEGLARAIASCTTPVISGVGHETDFTIADFVADLRAATPTAAAVAATPDGPALLQRLNERSQRLQRLMQQQLWQNMQRLDQADQRLERQHPQRRLAELDRRGMELQRRMHSSLQRLLDARDQRLHALIARLQARHPAQQLARLQERSQSLNRRLGRALNQQLETGEQRLAALARALHAVSPLAVLERGYAVVRDADGQAMTQESQFEKGCKINLLMHGFEVDAEVSSTQMTAKKS